MSWKAILKNSVFEHDEEGERHSHLPADMDIWEDMNNPNEMKDILTKPQMGSGFQEMLKDKSYEGMDNFITDFKEALNITKINRGRYGVSNTISGMLERGSDELKEVYLTHFNKSNIRVFVD